MMQNIAEPISVSVFLSKLVEAKLSRWICVKLLMMVTPIRDLPLTICHEFYERKNQHIFDSIAKRFSTLNFIAFTTIETELHWFIFYRFPTSSFYNFRVILPCNYFVQTLIAVLTFFKSTNVGSCGVICIRFDSSKQRIEKWHASNNFVSLSFEVVSWFNYELKRSTSGS